MSERSERHPGPLPHRDSRISLRSSGLRRYCIVNGPGESKHADIGISLPGTGETPTAPVFIDGKKAKTLRGPTVAADFKALVIDYIERRYGVHPAQTAAE